MLQISVLLIPSAGLRLREIAVISWMPAIHHQQLVLSICLAQLSFSHCLSDFETFRPPPLMPEATTRTPDEGGSSGVGGA